MRPIAIAAFAGLLATAAHADTMKNCASAWQRMSPTEKGTTTYQDYSKTCLKRTSAVSPTAGMGPAYPVGSTAKCKDDTYSVSKHRSGTCSHHGGVARWLK